MARTKKKPLRDGGPESGKQKNFTYRIAQNRELSSCVVYMQVSVKEVYVTQVEQGQADVRAVRVALWKERYCRAHGLFLKSKCGVRAPNIRAAPEPTDKDIGWPEPMVSVSWGTGYITMTLDAYNKLKAKDKKLFSKLGGLQNV